MLHGFSRFGVVDCRRLRAVSSCGRKAVWSVGPAQASQSRSRLRPGPAPEAATPEKQVKHTRLTPSTRRKGLKSVKNSVTVLCSIEFDSKRVIVSCGCLAISFARIVQSTLVAKVSERDAFS